MPRVVHFEIFADDPQRAIAFYTDMFGWTFQQFGGQPYWLVTTGPDSEPGINGGLAPREGPRQSGSPTAYVGVIAVPDIDAAIAQANGQKAPVIDGKRAVPGVGWSAYFLDPEGNTFGVFQDDPKAA
jgi:predicted enzyme related to lactoylglutathione lyase